MKTFILAALIATSFNAHAGNDIDNNNDWSKSDTIRQAVLTSMLYVDYKQTDEMRIENATGYARKMGSQWYTYHEANPILRKQFTENGIRNYFLSFEAASIVVARALPREYRPAVQYALIVTEAITVIHNRKIGIKFKF